MFDAGSLVEHSVVFSQDLSMTLPNIHLFKADVDVEFSASDFS